MYSYAFNDPINNTDPSGFDVNGEDSTIGIMGWGGGVVGGAALSGFGASAGAGSVAGGALGTLGGAALGVTAIGGNILSTALTGFPGAGGSKGGTYSGVAPTAAQAAVGGAASLLYASRTPSVQVQPLHW